MAVWFYMRGSEQVGPVSFEDLQGLAAAGTLPRTNLVWSEGMAEWQPAGLVEGLFPGPPPQASPAPPTAPAASAYRPHVDNHLVKAILSTVFCCLPLGIVAIVKAAQVNGRLEIGDHEGAQRLSREASNWGNWSIGIGLVGGFIYAMFALIGALSS